VTNNDNTLFEKEHEDVLRSIRISRIIPPIIIGLLVVAYLLWNSFDAEAFSAIEWSSRMIFWFMLALVLLLVRHLAYAARIRLLSMNTFNWKKAIELIFIWEFSSSVSPTSVGGSAVALFVLSQEKISAARVSAIVLYSVVVDTLFFIFAIPLLYMIFGSQIIRPDIVQLSDLGAWGLTFMLTYIFIVAYGCFFFYGLVINPVLLKKVVVSLTYIPFLRRWRTRAVKFGDDLIIASKEILKNTFSFHIKAFLFTVIAWSCRFLLLSCIIIAFTNISTDFWSQFALYGRLQTMYVIMQFSPTPGGAGFAEFVFEGFLSDYVPAGIALVVAFVWRLISYYFYLFAGAVVVPNWLRNVLNERKLAKSNA